MYELQSFFFFFFFPSRDTQILDILSCTEEEYFQCYLPLLDFKKLELCYAVAVRMQSTLTVLRV